MVSAATVLVLLAVWWAAAELRLVSPVFLPGPADVLRQAVVLVSKGYMDSTLLEHVAASLMRALLALAATVLVGVPIGIAMGLTTVGRGIFDPLIEFIRPIPPLAYLPLVIIWLGIGEPSKVLVIAIAMLAPITIATASGVRAAPTERLNAARSMGASRAQLVRHVILPSALPSILTGLRIALGAGWSTLVAAELVAATRGLGFMIQSASAFLVTDVVIAGIIVIAAIAFSLEIGIRLAERTLVPWTGKS
jgi:taurine transport system permease protein